jgi:hypothetical protein
MSGETEKANLGFSEMHSRDEAIRNSFVLNTAGPIAQSNNLISTQECPSDEKRGEITAEKVKEDWTIVNVGSEAPAPCSRRADVDALSSHSNPDLVTHFALCSAIDRAMFRATSMQSS